MPINNKYLPHYHFIETHSIKIAASQADVMHAVLNYRGDDDAFFKFAIGLRELPIRLLDKITGQHRISKQAFCLDNFTKLEHIEQQELIMGLTGKFWQLNYGQQPILDAASFLAFSESDSAKLTLHFWAEKISDTHTQLTTETRVFCIDQKALSNFRPYWYLIRPVSGLIRKRILMKIQQNCQVQHT